MAFTINSTAFKEGGTIPKQYTCDGTDVSPPLSWEGAPAATKSFALIMDDPDAPAGTFNHWVLYDLPGETKGLSEGVVKDPALPTGAKQGVTSFRRAGYEGPCPPRGPAHRYFFSLYALDIPTLGLGPKASPKTSPKTSKEEVEGKMKGHIIGKAVIMGRYGR
ncbi:MAG: YbhB/YbcL family Raf kinase inhibitor-like protein [Nitrospirae bacterium]|nr:YbhB/YbcL family Raf kinase inhibitor-like protein [Nitrospirota bacterium]MBI5096349.1 YbhB/YbcL family Raf kinase inhibitor-like protein [Nitrospirota bacterium]